LKLKQDEPLSIFALSFNVRRYSEVERVTAERDALNASVSGDKAYIRRQGLTTCPLTVCLL
jgi:hypothetical protein